MADRPVTLVEAEAWLAQVEAYYRGGHPWPMTRSEVRRAEQALADRDLIARAIFDTKYPHYELLDRDELWAEFGAIGRQDTYYEMADSVVALRASQGGAE